MAKTGFYDTQEDACYPFLANSIGHQAPPAVNNESIVRLPKDTIVDFGAFIGTIFNIPFDKEVRVYLAKVQRTDSTTFEFEFQIWTDADPDDLWPLYDRTQLLGLVGKFVFCRKITDDAYTTTWGSLLANAGVCGTGYAGEAYLVTGDLSSLADLLPGGLALSALYGDHTGAIVEPALVKNFGQIRLNAISYAGHVPTLAQSPEGCHPYDYSAGESALPSGSFCVPGDILFEEGYNAEITVDEPSNALVIGARAGKGAGPVCDEVSVFSDETPYDPNTGESSVYFTGGPSCTQVLRSINGLGGPDVNIRGGTGVVVTPDRDNHTVRIDINLGGLSLLGCSEIPATPEPIVQSWTAGSAEMVGYGYVDAIVGVAEVDGVLRANALEVPVAAVTEGNGVVTEPE